MARSLERQGRAGDTIALVDSVVAQHADNLQIALGELCANGYARLEWLPQLLQRLLMREARYAAAVPGFRRIVEAEGWRNVSRVTLLPRPRGVVEQVASSKRLAPLGTRLGEALAEQVTTFGEREKVTVLKYWQPTRIVYNLLGQGSMIPEHTDPESLSGLVAVNSLHACRQRLAGNKAEMIAPGTTTLLAGADLAAELGIEQVPHRVTTSATYTSVNYTNNRLPPSF